MRRISEKGKMKEGRGKGRGADYKPYIECREFNSMGTCSTPIDWKTGRTVQLLSQAEKVVWFLLRWDDRVEDVLEQYPLELSKTVRLAEELGIRHPKDQQTRMTTDFLVFWKGGSRTAVCVKASKADLENKRTTEKLYLEKMYWESEDVPFSIVVKSEVNVTAANNVRLVTEFYNAEDVFDEISALKHLVARRMIPADLESRPLDFKKMLNAYREVVDQWMKLH